MASRSEHCVGAYDAKTHFSELLEKAEAGFEITITKHGTPVARLVPIKKRYSAQERRAAIARIAQLSQGLSLGGITIRELVTEGRR
jgi:prevent-host-death family protein